VTSAGALHERIEREEGLCVHFDQPFHYWECEAESLLQENEGPTGADPSSEEAVGPVRVSGPNATPERSWR
jgi:hypothetical protein